MSTLPENERIDMRWDGWGDPARAHGLPGGVKLLLTAVLGRTPKVPRVPRLAEVSISTPPLPGDDLAALAKAVGEGHVDAGHDVRLLHAGGKSTPDLLRRRQAEQVAPGAVVLPGTEDEVAAVLAVASERGLAVVPFGGGTAVTGGLEPDAGPHRGVVSLDLRRLSGLVAFDAVDQEATFLAGTTAPAAETLLAERGFELGHFPQSFEFATLGGFAAMRSSGQNSAGYGRFDAMVTGLRVVTPTGALDLGRAPGSAAGPDLVRWFLGSEGTFGVITQLTPAGAPRPGGAAVRRVDLSQLRRRRGGAAPRGAARHGAYRDPLVRRGGDRRLAGPGRPHRPGAGQGLLRRRAARGAR